MRENQTFMEDMMTLGGSVLGNLLGARHELKAQGKERLDSLARHLDLVTRSEFEAAFAMLAKARVLQEELNERLAVLEAKMGISARGKPRPASKRHLPSVKNSNRRRKRG